MYHMLYAKGPSDKRFAPIDWQSGNQVINKMFATMFNEENTAKLRGDLPALTEANPGWIFELRKCG